jgi:hypothetical protein
MKGLTDVFDTHRIMCMDLSVEPKTLRSVSNNKRNNRSYKDMIILQPRIKLKNAQYMKRKVMAKNLTITCKYDCDSLKIDDANARRFSDLARTMRYHKRKNVISTKKDAPSVANANSFGPTENIDPLNLTFNSILMDQTASQSFEPKIQHIDDVNSKLSLFNQTKIGMSMTSSTLSDFSKRSKSVDS